MLFFTFVSIRPFTAGLKGGVTRFSSKALQSIAWQYWYSPHYILYIILYYIYIIKSFVCLFGQHASKKRRHRFHLEELMFLQLLDIAWPTTESLGWILDWAMYKWNTGDWNTFESSPDRRVLAGLEMELGKLSLSFMIAVNSLVWSLL